MENDFALSSFLAAARAIHIGACLLLLSIFAFDRLMIVPLSPAPSVRWPSIQKKLFWFAFIMMLLSGAAWLGLIAIDMSDESAKEALQLSNLSLVLNKTHFGRLWKIRSIFAAATGIAAVMMFVFKRSAIAWIAFASSALLVMSLSGAGHGTFGDSSNTHQFADALHLLIAGFWPESLLPFAIVLFGLRRANEPDDSICIAQLTRRFSIMSLISVALLTGTGLINAWFLIARPANLFLTFYGKILMIKLVFFCLLIGIGAINLLILKPRLSQHQSARRSLQINVGVETIFATIVIVLVAILGMIEPAIH